MQGFASVEWQDKPSIALHVDSVASFASDLMEAGFHQEFFSLDSR
jgi:hypothetical protein